MEKGLEIAFQTNGGLDERIPQALAALTSAEFPDLAIKYNIFLVDLEGQKYFRILFMSPKLMKDHPLERRKIREAFDSLAHLNLSEVMGRYEDLKAQGKASDHKIKFVKEEYDLWEDPIWKYI